MSGLNRLFYLICTLSLLWSSSVFTSDGVLEINQACAVNGGCFSGDTGGFPVYITQEGSYRLTGNLTLPNANTTGIEARAPHVTIDLNGFSIIGVAVCDGAPLECSPTGSGIGVLCRSDFDCEDLTLRNGSIHGMGNNGVSLWKNGHAVDLHVVSNGGFGIHFVNGAFVKNCSIRKNGDSGISSSVGGVSLRGAILTENIVVGNAGYGMQLTGPAVVVGNTLTFNEEKGLFGNVAAYGGNLISNNTNGAVEAGADEMGVNICDGDTTCP